MESLTSKFLPYHQSGCFTAILVDTGLVYMVGNGTLGRLGTGESKNVLKPTKVSPNQDPGGRGYLSPLALTGMA